MQRLLLLKEQISNLTTLDHTELKRTIFGPNYLYREESLQFLKDYPKLDHYHLNGDSKE